MKRNAYKRLKMNDFNTYDTERILRENIYDLEQENIRIEDQITRMVEQQIPVPVIMDWLRQLENNAGENVYVNSLIQHGLRNFDFSTSSVYKKG